MDIEFFHIDEYEDILSLWDHTGLPYEREDRDSRESLERQIHDDHVVIYTLKDNGSIIGVVIGTSDGRKGWINRLAIDPEYRGRRLAALLVDKVEEWFASRGISIIAALIEDRNFPSMAAFKHCGYEPWGNIVYFRKKINAK